MAKVTSSVPIPVRHPNQQIKPWRIRKCDLCRLLNLSPNGLECLIKRDLSFPKPIKDGNSRQAPAYFILAEVEAWQAAQIAQRDAAMA